MTVMYDGVWLELWCVAWGRNGRTGLDWRPRSSAVNMIITIIVNNNNKNEQRPIVYHSFCAACLSVAMI